jgi:MFS family permease
MLPEKYGPGWLADIGAVMCGSSSICYFSDRIGRTRTMAVSFAAAGFAYLMIPHLAGLWLWAALSAVIGFAFGPLFSVSGPLAGDCFGMATLRGHLRADSHRLRLHIKATWSVAERPYSLPYD